MLSDAYHETATISWNDSGLSSDQLAEKGKSSLLILPRRPGEALVIELSTGERIEVTVMSIKGEHLIDVMGEKTNEVVNEIQKSL